MNWNDLGSKVATLYVAVADWVLVNPVETDIGLGLVIAGSLLWYTKRAKKMRSRARRLMWGTLMRRKDRVKYQKMILEDFIGDAFVKMKHDGDLTDIEENLWIQKLAKAYGLTGLLPTRDQASVKRGVNWRLLQGWFTKKKPTIPGGHPSQDLVVDPNYKPEFEVARKGLNQSKYAMET